MATIASSLVKKSSLLSQLIETYVHTRGLSMTPCRFKAKIIDGVKIAKDIRNELKAEVDTWMSLGNRRPQLIAILVGDDRASHAYVSAKMKAAKEVGIASETIKLPACVSESALLAQIDRLNKDNKIDGILVQLPLPEHITERAICNAVAPHKDVDGFHIVNVGRFCLDMKTLVPCTPLGVHELIKRSGVSTLGKNAVVCGRSKNVGMPIAMLLHADGTGMDVYSLISCGETGAMDATTTICHRYTPPEQLAIMTRTADIIVSAAGVPNLIKADMVKEGVCIIDVGITRIKDERTGKDRLVGDVEFEGVSDKAGYITPVPGGVGPMTVAMLMKNTLLAARKEVVYNILDPGAVVQKKASQLRP